MTPSVSVVIPAFNSAAYVGDTLDSVLAQTHPPLEVIVVDDGSTDRTPDIVRGYGSRVTLVTQENAGQGPARNHGVHIARGEWIAFVDADDLWLPEKLERQLARAKESGCIWVYSDRYHIGLVQDLPERYSELQPLLEGDIFETLLLQNIISTSSVIIRRDVVAESGGFPPNLSQDWDLWLRIAERHPIAVCPEPLVKYRLHAGGATRQVDRQLQARIGVMTRALALPRARALPRATVRRIWSQTYCDNGGMAQMGGRRLRAILEHLRAIRTDPVYPNAYRGLVRAMIR